MLVALIISFPIVAAFLNALSSILQRYQAGHVEAEDLFRRHFIKSLSKNPKWVAAFGLQILAFFFQAAALRKGAMVVVQPLLAVELVFILLILHFYKGMAVGKKEWAAILLIIGGLTGMIISAQPKAGTHPFYVSGLIVASSVVAGIIAVGIYVVRRTKSSRYRAAVSGVAAGFSFALVATLTKIVTRQLSHGLLSLVSGWQVWALFAAGIVSVIMAQNTYGAGPIAVSQPAMMLTEPIISVIFGIYIFGDAVNLSPLNLAFALFTGLIAATGITILGRSKQLRVLAI